MFKILNDQDAGNILKALGYDKFHYITLHYGEGIDSDQIEAVVTNSTTHENAIIKFCYLGLCNFTKPSRSLNNLEFALGEDDAIKSLIAHEDAIKYNKTFFSKLIEKEKELNLNTEDKITPIIINQYKNIIQANLKEIKECTILLQDPAYQDGNHITHSKTELSKIQSRQEYLLLINEKINKLKNFIEEKTTCPVDEKI